MQESVDPLSKRFSDALIFAAELHAKQRRRISRTPFVAHLLRVAGIVLEHGGTEDEAIAALLHDAIEDQGGAAARNEIRRRFGSVVVDIVDECSDTDESPKPPWRQRKDAYLAHLPDATPSARLVSAADKLDNIRSILENLHSQGNAIWKHFKGGRDGSLWYYRSVVAALKAAGTSPLVEELDRRLSELEELAHEV